MIGGIEETSASFEARSAPRSYPTEPFIGGQSFLRYEISIRSLVGRGQQRFRHLDAQRLCGLEVDNNSNLVGRNTGRSMGFSPLRIRPA
jgi:hypothetical protein